MLPGAEKRTYSTSRVQEYFRRLFHYPQMDLEYTFWQMYHLCFHPSRVYRTTSWHRHTKNQWARDDPAFVAILAFFLTIASIAYCIAFRVFNLWKIIKLVFWSVFVDFITVGVVLATIGWFIANKYLKQPQHHGTNDQSVEWVYAFDIHCNSFFPVFLILYVCQFFFLPIFLSNQFVVTLAVNTMYLVAVILYYHITFLGYSALPFLHNTVVFLYPIGGFFVAYVISLLLNWNMCIFVINSYFSKFTQT